MLFPLFSQLDYPVTGDPEPPKTSNANVVPKPSTGGGNAVATVTGKKDPVLCSALMQFICELVEGSTSIQQQVFTIFIGPGCPWGPIYGSGPMSVSHRLFADLTDVTLADDDSNSIPTVDVNKAIIANALCVWP